MTASEALSPFLLAKHAWDVGDTDKAQLLLNLLLATPEHETAIWVGKHVVAAFAPGPFEAFVVRLASSDDLLVPFDIYIAKLWRALPAQYVVQALELRQAEIADLGERSLQVVYRASDEGLLSSRIADYRRLCRVVLRPQDHPHLARAIDWPQLEQRQRHASESGARAAFGRAHRELIANLVMYGTIHRRKVIYPDEVAAQLTDFAESDPELFEVTARCVRAWADRPDADEIARVGLRCGVEGSACVALLAAALDEREFDEFVASCMPN